MRMPLTLSSLSILTSSAGQAESVSHYLSVPVLRHASLKPSYSCIAAIRNYFASLPTPVQDEELIVVGDRIFTDIVLANRMSRRRNAAPNVDGVLDEKRLIQNSRVGPLAIWTTGVWERESMTTRWLEKLTMQGVHRLVHGRATGNAISVPGGSPFVKPLPSSSAESDTKQGWFRRLLGSLPRA